MIDNSMTSGEVVEMAARKGFRCGSNKFGRTFLYATPSGFGMEFAAQWLTDDGIFVRQQVQDRLNAMLESAKQDEKIYVFLKNAANVKRINDACIAYGMVYDDSEKKFYYVVDGSALFGVDHDYIASLVVTGKASIDHLEDLLDTFKETAEFELNKSSMASGKQLIGTHVKKRKRANGTGKKKCIRK